MSGTGHCLGPCWALSLTRPTEDMQETSLQNPREKRVRAAACSARHPRVPPGCPVEARVSPTRALSGLGREASHKPGCCRACCTPAVPEHLTRMPGLPVCGRDPPPTTARRSPPTPAKQGWGTRQAKLEVDDTGWKARRPRYKCSLPKTKPTCLGGWWVTQEQEPRRRQPEPAVHPESSCHAGPRGGAQSLSQAGTALS